MAIVTDQGFFLVQGYYSNYSTKFIVNTTFGTDTLVVYDGNPDDGLTQTGIVLFWVTLANLAYTNNLISYVP